MKRNVTLAALLALAVVLRGEPAQTVTVDARHARVWEGWGCSLAWWANAVGGGRYESLYADLFFSTKDTDFLGETLPGLGLNIVRYNIGGGGRPADPAAAEEQLSPSVPAFKDIDGFWIDRNQREPASAGWDWSRDARQRSLLTAALARGVNHVEFFSNAPMWWMMDTRSSAGGRLRRDREDDFAHYVASVVAHARTAWHIPVDSVEPFNEPSATWWKFPQRQEGATIPAEQQVRVVRALAEELRAINAVTLTASDENTMREALGTVTYLKSDVAASASGRTSGKPREPESERTWALVAKVNVHAYNGLQPWRDNAGRRALHDAVDGKRLWMSEFGDRDPSGATLARTIFEDLNHLRPAAWVYWQPLEPRSAWGLVNGDYEKGAPGPDSGRPTRIYPKYRVFAQITRTIRPGMRVVSCSDDRAIVADDASSRRLVLLWLNTGLATDVRCDFGPLGDLPAQPNARAVVLDTGKPLPVGVGVIGRAVRFTAPAGSLVTVEMVAP